ncbi:DNA-3-methyladenine glycosylase, partial [Fimicolochytrium jonesii]|uniref:DNA-3-methyladenine glycosylase n=1 Tax=Fimicolochytrium jonesii TaxID=1396493 RepID=UPI0022FEF97D
PAEAVARDLLGKRLVRLLPSSNETMRLTGIIVETEAYCGEDDKACHIYAGRRTKRTEIIYGPKGHAYVYFTYGMHHMLNVVCGSESYPEAVLIRALQPEVESVATMRTLRSTRKRKAEAVGGETAAVKHVKEMREADLCSGPAKLCQAMGIDLAQNGVDMTCTDAGLYFEDVGVVDEASEETAIAIQAGPRIGIDYAAEWKDKPLRFFYDQNPHVSLFK